MEKENKGSGEGEPEVEQEDEEEYPVPQCPLHEAVAVQPSPMGGRGLFALRDFAAGDGELRICGAPLALDEHALSALRREPEWSE